MSNKRNPDSDVSDNEDNEEEASPTSISHPIVLEKYKKAAEIANQAVELAKTKLNESLESHKKIQEICAEVDAFIVDNTKKIYNKDKKMEKGVAFPTCISLNNIVGHFSPDNKDTTEAKAGDLAKIDLGVQIDGFISVVAHSYSVGGGVTTGRKADAVLAAHYGAEAAIRLLKPGNKNYQVSEVLAKIAQEYKVNCVQGVLSHQLERFNIDGTKVILNRIEPEHKVDDVEFEVGDVWTIDVVVSSGEGKPKETGDEKTNIYKRHPDRVYQLKMQASRSVFKDILTNHSVFPFNLRDLESKTARFGVKECVEHDLLQPYPVLQERDGEVVAHIKYTVLITPNAVVRITGVPLDVTKYQSEHKINDADVKAILNASLKLNASASSASSSNAAAKKKKKKAEKKKAEKEAEMDTTTTTA